jgi:uncharacterized protein YjbJ (UPF0337 family)
VCATRLFDPRNSKNYEQSSWTSNGVAGSIKKASGTEKKAVGKATGNRRLVAKGRADRTEGRVRSAVGKVKDAARELVGRR